MALAEIFMFGIQQNPKCIQEGHMGEHADAEQNQSAALVPALDSFRDNPRW